jgi:hypothetical protein
MDHDLQANVAEALVPSSQDRHSSRGHDTIAVRPDGALRSTHDVIEVEHLSNISPGGTDVKVDRSHVVQHTQIPDGFDSVVDRILVDLLCEVDHPTHNINVVFKQKRGRFLQGITSCHDIPR